MDDSEQNNGSTNNEFDNTPQKQTQNGSNKKNVQKTNDGYRYTTIATINIPKINVQYPILDGETDSEAETEALLKISPTKFLGSRSK